MLPAALMPRFGVELLERGPEPERAVAHGQARRERQAAALELEQHLTPALFRFTHPVLDREQLLLAALVNADDHQSAQPLVLGAQPRVDPVSTHTYTQRSLASFERRQSRYSSIQRPLSRATTEADSPAASGPRSAARASCISPVDTPCRYSQGSTASTFFARRTYGGTRRE